MQNILDTRQFLAKLQSEGILEKKRYSALPPIFELSAGIALVAMALIVPMPDTASFSMLVAGGILAIIGMAFATRLFDKSSGYYIYSTTKSRLRTHNVYVSDRELCRQIIEKNDFARLADVRKNNSSLSMLKVTVSDDSRFAVIQLYEYDMAFVPATECAVACDKEAAQVRDFFNNPI